MTENELYTAMNKAGIDFEVVEIFEGARWLRIDVDETSKYKLDEMPEDIEATVGLYFEDEWQEEETKRDVMQYMGKELIRLGIDDGGATAKAIDQLEETGAFNEIDYFDYIERLLNDAGYYTYNSDNWFEIYEGYEGGE
jgi:hypothetical protein